jgi:uncharacterized protein (DUF697 family)
MRAAARPDRAGGRGVMGLPVSFGALRGLVKEIQVSARGGKPLVVGGARELAAVLRRELGRDAKPGAIRQSDDPLGGAVFVYVLGHEPTEDDEQALKRARRARVPIVAVVTGRVADDVAIPFVLATDVVPVPAGEGFPVEAIARAIAARLGEDGAPLAARLPVLRGPVRDVLIASFARRCGVLAAAVFVPGADLPVLALHQVRMVLRLEQAYGLDADPRERAPEVLATIAAGLGLRAVARQLLAVVPVAGWAVKGAVAYAGTRALGEATVKRLELGMPGGDGADPSTPPRAAASRDAR